MFSKLWKDEAGSLVLEYILIATLVSLATVVGLNAVGLALNIELVELARAIGTISQDYSYAGFTTCRASVAGSQALDIPISIPAGAVAASDTQDVNLSFCP